MKIGNSSLYGGIIVVVLIYAATIMRLDKLSIIDAGTFGDMFGGLNTLFTGVAFAGVVISLNQQNKALEQQQKALDQQQEELNLYKDELKENTDQLKEHSALMRLQRIESTIFNLLSYHDSDLKNIYIEGEYPEYNGLEGIKLLDKIMYELLRIEGVAKIQDEYNVEHIDIKKKIIAYDKLKNDDEPLTKFKYIIRYIDELKDIDKEQKKEFINMVIHILPRGLLVMYHYNICKNKDKETQYFTQVFRKHELLPYYYK